MKLHKDEKELSIVWNFADKNAVVSITAEQNDYQYRHLKQRTVDYPDTYRVQMEKSHDGWSFLSVECPKELAIGLRAPSKKKQLSENELENLRERAKQMRMKSKSLE